MAQVVHFGTGGEGKIRSFAVGFLLAVVTFGIYQLFWYYLVNDELKDVGIAKGDANLGQSSPAMSVVALVVGWIVVIPTLVSMFNYGRRIKRAERLAGIRQDEQISTTIAILLLFPGACLIIPAILWYWYVTKHQNAALRAIAGLPAA